ncbi:hypothetical protein FOCC_FOCC004129 [Frankliniella occidentalis]|nr:hypothetical protein FOCC_FOCC004129 [Frankliniella occidentalis]
MDHLHQHLQVFYCCCFLILVYKQYPLVLQLTGAGGGLGRVLALALARRGCQIACADVAPKPNKQTADDVVRQTGAVARAYTTDLSKKGDVDALVAAAIKDFGHVDILVSNAGQLEGGAVWDVTDDGLDLILDVNLRATMLLVRALMPHMRARRSGHLVAVSSLAGELDMPCIAAYAATKAGLSRFMGCLYQDLCRDGLGQDIHITTIRPFFMATYQRLVDSVKFGKLTQWLLPFMDPAESAELMVDAIARQDHVVNLPFHLAALAVILRLLPYSVVAFIVNNIVKFDIPQLVSYQKRHQELDADLLHELLTKKYTLDQDPEPVCRRLAEELAAGRPLPHDYKPLAAGVEAFYRQHQRPVPEAVRKVFPSLS